jgi:hypothetical protein
LLTLAVTSSEDDCEHSANDESHSNNDKRPPSS